MAAPVAVAAAGRGPVAGGAGCGAATMPPHATVPPAAAGRRRRAAVRATRAPAGPPGRLDAVARVGPAGRAQPAPQGAVPRPRRRDRGVRESPRPATEARLPGHVRAGRGRARRTAMNTPPKNDRLLRALRREPVDATPVWLMRQAGRYLPEYRATRARAGSFMGLATNPELACEVTLQPLERFQLDAAILFSDILTIPDAMGLGLSFAAGEGPRFERPVRSAADVARLHVPDPESELRYVMDAVRTIRRELGDRVPLIGFSGSPWTLAGNMFEGGGSDNFSRIKALLLDDPALLTRLLEINTQAVIAYLAAQRAAGAQVLMVFDTWGGTLAPHQYREFSLRWLARI